MNQRLRQLAGGDPATRGHLDWPTSSAAGILALKVLGHYANCLHPAQTGRRGAMACEADIAVQGIAVHTVSSGALSTQPVIAK